MKSFLILWVLIFNLFSIYGVGFKAQAQEVEPYLPPTNFPIPIMNLEDSPFDWESIKGHWTIVNFWASWCSPCVAEFPLLLSLPEQFQKHQLKVLAVNVGESSIKIQEFLSTYNFQPHPNRVLIIRDNNQFLYKGWKAKGLPTTYLLDPQGKVRAQWTGSFDPKSPILSNFISHMLTSNPI